MRTSYNSGDTMNLAGKSPEHRQSVDCKILVTDATSPNLNTEQDVINDNFKTNLRQKSAHNSHRRVDSNEVIEDTFYGDCEKILINDSS